MARQNRVTPFGELIATPARGTLYGNRGCLHDGDGRVVRWAVGQRWIACELAFKGRRRSPLLQPGRFTELFFLDEATALAAGHRPCVECRRADFVRFADAVAAGNDLPARPTAAAVDSLLQPERPTPQGPRPWMAPAADLPDGAMVVVDGAAHLVRAGAAWPWTPGGYAPPVELPASSVDVLTPPTIVRALRAGYVSRAASSTARSSSP